MDRSTEIYLKMMAPVCPHISEELWALKGKPYSIHTQAWPRVDEAAIVEEEITLAVQVNGKVRDHVTVARMPMTKPSKPPRWPAKECRRTCAVSNPRK